MAAQKPVTSVPIMFSRQQQTAFVWGTCSKQFLVLIKSCNSNRKSTENLRMLWSLCNMEVCFYQLLIFRTARDQLIQETSCIFFHTGKSLWTIQWNVFYPFNLSSRPKLSCEKNEIFWLKDLSDIQRKQATPLASCEMQGKRRRDGQTK